jgi:hypothetical protein
MEDIKSLLPFCDNNTKVDQLIKRIGGTCGDSDVVVRLAALALQEGVKGTISMYQKSGHAIVADFLNDVFNMKDKDPVRIRDLMVDVSIHYPGSGFDINAYTVMASVGGYPLFRGLDPYFDSGMQPDKLNISGIFCDDGEQKVFYSAAGVAPYVVARLLSPQWEGKVCAFAGENWGQDEDKSYDSDSAQ